MNLCPSTHHFPLILLMLALALTLVTNGRAQPAEPAAAQREPLKLEIKTVGNQQVVAVQKLMNVLASDALFPGASNSWDSERGVLRIQANNVSMDLLSRQAAMVVNGRTKPLAQPIMLRQGEVLIPVETVQVVFQSLNVDFSLPAKKATPSPSAADVPEISPGLLSARATPSPSPTTVPTATPAPTQTPVTTPATLATATPAITTARGEAPPLVLPSVATATQPGAKPAEQANTPIEAPKNLTKQASLTWGQLADTAHRRPPSRVTILCDRPLEAVAQSASAGLQQGEATSVNLVVANDGKRNNDQLLAQVLLTQPELVIDLQADTSLSATASDLATYRVWVAHEALWPQDRQTGGAPAPTDQNILRYRRHQNQNLALGSLLRTELGRHFTDQSVYYELSPGYLLRRLDAPATAVVIPVGPDGAPPEQALKEQLAESITTAVKAYINGMKSVQF